MEGGWIILRTHQSAPAAWRGFFWGFLGEAIDFYLAEKNLSLLQPAPPDCKFENHPAGLEYVNIR